MYRTVLALLCLGVAATGVADLALKDPTRPGGWQKSRAKAPPPRKVELQSILRGADRRIAVINGTVMREGAEVDGIKLIAVRKNEVDVLVAGRGPMVLRLASERVRKEMKP